MADLKNIEKKYSNGEITVVWKPGTCIHSENCFRGLPQVFDPSKCPWITIDGATTEQIKAQVDKCPSGALSWFYDKQDGKSEEETKQVIVIEATKNGPLLVQGKVTIKHPDGRTENRDKVTALCRCGHSSNKPFCDGTHKKIGFKG